MLLPLERIDHPVAAPGSLQGRVVLVTGASGGLGRATALACARVGATVVLAGRKVRALEAVYDEIEALGGPQAAIYPVDLEGAGPGDHDDIVDAVRLQCGRLDGLVHAAAHFDGLRTIDQTKPLDWLRAQQVGLNAPVLLTRACLPLLREAADAAVVFVFDDPARVGKAYWGSYGVSKFGLAGFASVLHDEQANGPLRVHGLLPAPMRTTLRRMAYFGEDATTRPTPDRTGAAVAFLLGAQAHSLRGKTLDLRTAQAS
ncbi:SDR family NAD(P)-dependent oxidoreductase [Dokdonella sp.]|uniref:SDR family NAD(P)-dependent oxidoreductase n=1 Tax=Dokdonella sp. TaxID=2291710 RepID=UPI0025BA50F9|nr:SDR family NAD(P)-dependent oxidoreductase [Dokdonella sp.]MBX3692041.1 SDR family NAD(P)-dependent oxidoreductase [Dokdonella sp.]MCW5567002.1 SDR family NAD(P)-dependent oxidoreductase [Dokdonella sp.]